MQWLIPHYRTSASALWSSGLWQRVFVLVIIPKMKATVPSETFITTHKTTPRRYQSELSRQWRRHICLPDLHHSTAVRIACNRVYLYPCFPLAINVEPPVYHLQVTPLFYLDICSSGNMLHYQNVWELLVGVTHSFVMLSAFRCLVW